MLLVALRSLVIVPLLCCSFGTLAQFDQCSIDVTSAVHGSQTWLQLGHPLNMTKERLGRLQDSAGARLIALAYQGWQQGKTEQQINSEVMALCKTFSIDALLDDLVDGDVPVQRTVCGDASESLVTAMNDAGGANASVAKVMFQLKGEEPAPNWQSLAEQAVALKKQNNTDMQILEKLYDSCAAKSTAYKVSLGKEVYVE